MHRTEPHLGRVEPGPVAVHQPGTRAQAVARKRVLGGEHEPRAAIANLRAVAGGHPARRAVKHRLQFRQFVRARVAPQAIVFGVSVARGVENGGDFAGENPVVDGIRQARVALHRERVHRLAADVETLRDLLGGLPHRQTDHRVGQPFQ